VEFYFSLRVYLRYHFLVICENVNCYNVLRGIGVGEQLRGDRCRRMVRRHLQQCLLGNRNEPFDERISDGQNQ